MNHLKHHLKRPHCHAQGCSNLTNKSRVYKNRSYYKRFCDRHSSEKTPPNLPPKTSPTASPPFTGDTPDKLRHLIAEAEQCMVCQAAPALHTREDRNGLLLCAGCLRVIAQVQLFCRGFNRPLSDLVMIDGNDFTSASSTPKRGRVVMGESGVPEFRFD